VDSFLVQLCLLSPIAIGNAKHRICSHHAVIRVYDDAGNVIETHEHKAEFCESLCAGSTEENPLTVEAQIFILGARERKF